MPGSKIKISPVFASSFEPSNGKLNGSNESKLLKTLSGKASQAMVKRQQYSRPQSVAACFVFALFTSDRHLRTIAEIVTDNKIVFEK